METSSAYWVHNLSPFLWQFPSSWQDFGPGGLRWYGISYLAGFVIAYYLLLLAHKKGKSPYNKEQVLNLMTFQILGVLLGGRIGFVLLYRTEEFFNDPLMIFYVWQGGMASHGGFIGVILATYWYTKKSYQSFWPVADLIATVVPPGLFFGRFANFINGELWGKKTEVFWGVLFPKAPDFMLGIARHPSQIYTLCSKVFSSLFLYSIGSGNPIFIKDHLVDLEVNFLSLMPSLGLRANSFASQMPPSSWICLVANFILFFYF